MYSGRNRQEWINGCGRANQEGHELRTHELSDREPFVLTCPNDRPICFLRVGDTVRKLPSLADGLESNQTGSNGISELTRYSSNR